MGNVAGTGMDTHVDDWVEFRSGDAYARWFLFLSRLPAHMKNDFMPWIGRYKLFATWRGKRHRVTGASRMGDVWLTADFKRDTGYERRVSVTELSEWSPTSRKP